MTAKREATGEPVPAGPLFATMTSNLGAALRPPKESGRRDIVGWAVAALALGFVSVALTIVYILQSPDLTRLQEQQSAIQEWVAVRADVGELRHLLEGPDLTTMDGRTPADLWTDASARLHRLCQQVRNGGASVAAGLPETCAAVESLAALFSANAGLLLPSVERTPAEVSRRVTILDGALATSAVAVRQALRDEIRIDARAQQISIIAIAASSAGFVLAGTILVFLIGRTALRWQQERQRAIEAEADAQFQHTRLLDAIEAMPAAFILYDPDERLVLFNRRATELYPMAFNRDNIGRKFEDLMDPIGLQVLNLRDDAARSAWKRQMVERFRNPGTAVDVLRPDGMWLRAHQYRASNGQMAVIRVDITELKNRELALESSERRYAELVNSLSEILFSIDQDGIVSYVSRPVEKILGYRPDSLQGAPLQGIFHAPDRPALEQAIARVAGGDRMQASLTCRALTSAGELRFTDIRLSRGEEIPGVAGSRSISGAMRDVHGQYELEQQLQLETGRLRSIVKSSGALILLLDPEARIVMVNSGFLALTDRSESDLIDQPLTEIEGCAEAAAAIGTWLRSAGDAPVHLLQFDTNFVDALGRRRAIRCTASPVVEGNGVLSYVVMMGVDETDRRDAEIRLFDASRLATLGEMASSVAHELNQPLAVVRLAAEAVAEMMMESPAGELRDATVQKLGRIVTQTERAAGIIRDLRTYARRPEGRGENFDAAAAVLTAVNLVQEQMRLARIRIDVSMTDEALEVFGHENRLQQVLINLLLNARDAILERPPGEKATLNVGTIAVAVDGSDGGGAVITVEDDGAGIPDTVLPRLFEPFFTTKPVGQGTGLGLSISHNIVRQMGGALTAENRPQGGARFRIVFPPAEQGVVQASLKSIQAPSS
jgi:PAS domain S-box-containing protein